MPPEGGGAAQASSRPSIEDRVSDLSPFTRRWKPLLSSHAQFIPGRNYQFQNSTPKDSEETYLTQLWKILNEHPSASRGSSSACALVGMSGIGKTELALAYAHEAADNNAYNVIWWIFSETEETLLKGYNDLLKRLGILDLTSSQEVIETLQIQLPAKCNRWLLIYDNVSNPLFLKGKTPTSKGDIIITTKEQLGWDIPQILVESFRPTEALDYLLKKLNDSGRKNTISLEEKKEMEKVSEMLGYLPLALSHSASYVIKKRNKTFKGYLKELSEKTRLILSYEPDFSSDPSPRSVMATITMAYDSLSLPSKKLLDYLSYLGSDDIPLNPFFSKSITEENIDELAQYSMVKKGEGELVSIHRLVQEVLRAQHQKDHQSAVLLEETVDQLTPFWIKKKQTIEARLLSFFSGRRVKKELDDILLIKQISFSTYPHLKLIKHYIESLVDKDRLDYLLLKEKYTTLKDIIEEMIDYTQHTTVSEQLSLMRSKGTDDRYSQEYLSSLAGVISSVDTDMCRLFLEVGAPLLTPEMDIDCVATILRPFRDYQRDKEEMAEIVEAVLKMKNERSNPQYYADLISAFASIPRGQKVSVALKASKIILPDIKGWNLCRAVKAIYKVHTREDWSDFEAQAKKVIKDSLGKEMVAIKIEALSHIFPESWERFMSKVKELMDRSIDLRGEYKIIEIFYKVPIEMRDEVIASFRRLSPIDSTIEDRIDLLSGISSLASDMRKEELNEVVLLAEQLFDVKSSGQDKVGILRALASIETAVDRENIVRIVGQYKKQVSAKLLSSLIKALFSIHIDERASVAAHSIFLLDDREWESGNTDVKSLVQAMGNLSEEERGDIASIIRQIIIDNNLLISTRGKYAIINSLSKMPKEERTVERILGIIKTDKIQVNTVSDSVIPAPSVSTSRVEWKKVRDLAKADAYEISKPLLNDTMTTFEACLIIEEISKISLADERLKIIKKVQRIDTADAEVILKLIKQAVRIPDEKWGIFILKVEELKRGTINRFLLYEAEEALELSDGIAHSTLV